MRAYQDFQGECLEDVDWCMYGPEEMDRLAAGFLAAGFNPFKVLESLAFQLCDEPEAAQRIAKIIGVDKATVEWLQVGYTAETKLHQLIDELSDFACVDFPENLEPFAATVRGARDTLQTIVEMVERLECDRDAVCAVLDKLDSDFWSEGDEER